MMSAKSDSARNGEPAPATTGTERSSDEERAARRARRRAARLARIDTTVPSPCIAVCQVDNATGRCIGCLRSLDEIRDWPIMSAAEKTATLARIAERRAALEAARGGAG